MNRRSAAASACLVLLAFDLCAAVYGEPDNIEPQLQTRADLVFYGGFEAFGMCDAAFNSAWGAPWNNRCNLVEVLTGNDALIGNNSWRVSYPQGGVGPNETGLQIPVDFQRLPGMPLFDSLYLRYYVMFETGFDFKLGGKLPGLMGAERSWQRSGGNLPDGTNGWTMRFMWRSGGAAVVYAYLPPGQYHSQYGVDIRLNRSFQTGKRHCVEQFIKINTVGRKDGVCRVWLDNEQVLDVSDIEYRTVDNSAGKIGGLYISTFHGGSDASWAPSSNSFARFDGFAMATSRVGPHDAAVDNTPPGTPANLHATPTATDRIDLKWDASSDPSGVRGYRIFRDDRFLQLTTGTSFADRGLQPGTRYCYSVSAVDAPGNESSRSAVVCASTLASGEGRAVDTLRLIPIADAHVHGAFPESNYGASTGLQIKANANPQIDRNAYLKFDLSEVGNMVMSASLVLTVRSVWSGSLRLAAWKVDDDTWTETGITYQNRPAFGGLIDTVGATSTGMVAIDVSAAVEAEARGDKVLTIGLTEDLEKGCDLHSREAAETSRPRLVVAFRNSDLSDSKRPVICRTDAGQSTGYRLYDARGRAIARPAAARHSGLRIVVNRADTKIRILPPSLR